MGTSFEAFLGISIVFYGQQYEFIYCRGLVLGSFIEINHVWDISREPNKPTKIIPSSIEFGLRVWGRWVIHRRCHRSWNSAAKFNPQPYVTHRQNIRENNIFCQICVTGTIVQIKRFIWIRWNCCCGSRWLVKRALGENDEWRGLIQSSVTRAPAIPINRPSVSTFFSCVNRKTNQWTLMAISEALVAKCKIFCRKSCTNKPDGYFLRDVN